MHPIADLMPPAVENRPGQLAHEESADITVNRVLAVMNGQIPT
jgi:hypothetical protein